MAQCVDINPEMVGKSVDIGNFIDIVAPQISSDMVGCVGRILIWYFKHSGMDINPETQIFHLFDRIIECRKEGDTYSSLNKIIVLSNMLVDFITNNYVALESLLSAAFDLEKRDLTCEDLDSIKSTINFAGPKLPFTLRENIFTSLFEHLFGSAPISVKAGILRLLKDKSLLSSVPNFESEKISAMIYTLTSHAIFSNDLSFRSLSLDLYHSIHLIICNFNFEKRTFVFQTVIDKIKANLASLDFTEINLYDCTVTTIAKFLI